MLTVKEFLDMFLDNYQLFRLYDIESGDYLMDTEHEGVFKKDIPVKYYNYRIETLDCVDKYGILGLNISNK